MPKCSRAGLKRVFCLYLKVQRTVRGGLKAAIHWAIRKVCHYACVCVCVWCGCACLCYVRRVCVRIKAHLHSIPALQDANIRQCVVSGSHMAFLLEDGRICRVGFSEKLPPAPGGKEKR